MKKMKIAMLVAAMASLSQAAVIWDGVDGVGAVSSGGYWWSYNDNAETADGGPGASTSDFPAGSTETDVMGPWVVEKGGMIDVNFTINPTTYKYPFAGIGFNWLDPEAPAPQSWSAFCVTYSLSGTVPVTIEIKLDATLDGYNAPATKMAAQAAMAQTCFPVAGFAQESGWGTKVTTAAAQQASQGMKFKAQLKTPPAAAATANLKISKICDEASCSGTGIINNAVVNSGLKLSQVGRTISLGGLSKASTTVELINMQGQVMAREVLTAGNKSVNFSRQAEGSYVVRVQSGKLSLTKMIVLR